MSWGRGGISLVAGATGLSRTTIHVGIKELEQPLGKARSGLGTARFRIRRPGGGRKPLTEQQPESLAELERLVDPLNRGNDRLAGPQKFRHLPGDVLKLGVAIRTLGPFAALAHVLQAVG